jgi:lycopene cyclase domain-containing protein
MTYVCFNAALLLAAVTMLLVLLGAWRARMRAVKTSAFVALLAFPWDYLAVTQGVWRYGDAGPRVFQVPLNDSLFIFCCSLITTVTLERFFFEPRAPRTSFVEQVPERVLHLEEIDDEHRTGSRAS